MSIGNNVSQPYEGPGDVELFPPRWAMHHLSDAEYAAMAAEHYRKQGPHVCPKCGGIRIHYRLHGYRCRACDY